MDAIPGYPVWLDIGATQDIPRLGARVVARPGGNIAVFRTADDRVFALDDRCPHKGGPLSQGAARALVEASVKDSAAHTEARGQ